MKKIVALALTVVMVLGLLAGCEKPMDVTTLAQKMDEAQKTVTALEGKMGMDLEATMAVPGMTLDMGFNLDADMKYKADMSAGYFKMKLGIEAMGQSEEVEMESYIAIEDGNFIAYTYENASDMWMKTEQDTTEYLALQEQLMNVGLKYSDIPAEKMTLAEEQETVDGKSCYVLTINLDGNYLKDSMTTVMESLTGEIMTEEDQAALAEMDWSALTYNITAYVDAATFLPVQMSGEVLGIGEMLNGLIATALAERMLGEGGEELEITIDVPKCSYTMTGLKYNDIEIPAVPQDAIDNAVTAEDIAGGVLSGDDYEDQLTNPPQEDGSFLLSYGGITASVTVPEGYIVYMAETDALVTMTEDLNAGYEEVVTYAKEEGYYLSHGEMDPINGYTVKTLFYDDSSTVIYAWKEINGGVMVVTVNAYGGTLDLSDVLNGVVTGE